MKKIFKYVLAATVFLSTSCGDDFLDSGPLDEVTEENFYRTPNQAYAALVGCYDGLQRVWGGSHGLPVVSEVLSDNAFGGTGNSDGFGYQMIDEFDKTRSAVDQNIFSDMWSAYYAAIYRCNVLLSKLDQVEWGAREADRSIYEAETRFLRAYMYFDMVRLWGNIPLVTEPTIENVPQASAVDVYRLIAQDLKFAAANLPATTYGAQAVATRGRVTKWAAESLIGRVYLYFTGYYGESDLAGEVSEQEALAYVEDVIVNSGHALVDDFSRLWPAASLDNYAGEDNIETVFAIKYTYTSDYNGNTDGNHWLVMFGIREQASYPYGNGWGAGTVNPKLWNAYSSDDSRRGASIISIAQEGIDFQNTTKQREYTGYYVKKYTPMVDEDGNSTTIDKGGVNFMIAQYQDYVSIRFADVLLMAAELGSANAQDYLDQVRERAGVAPVAATKANILEERRLEFAFEGHRYWDLLRQGVEVAAAAIAEDTQLLNGGTTVDKVILASNVIATKGLQQIPYTQITLSNNVLKQNTGW